MSKEELVQKYLQQALLPYRLNPKIVASVKKALQDLHDEVGGSGSEKKPSPKPSPKPAPKEEAKEEAKKKPQEIAPNTAAEIVARLKKEKAKGEG